MRIYRIGICLAILLAFETAIESRDLVSRTPLALETFDEAWRIIHETHFDTNFNGHNWQEVREKYRPRAAAARNGDSFREVIQEMLDLLTVSHLAIVPGEFAAEIESEEPAVKPDVSLEAADEAESGTLGMQLRYADKNLLVTRVEPGLPAERAGVKPGWILKRIGAVQTARLKQKTPKKLDERRRDFLAWRAASKKLSGGPGTKIQLEFLNDKNRSVTLELERVTAQGEPIQFGSLPVLYAHLDHESIRSPRGKQIGVIRFNIWMLPTAVAFNKAIDEHRNDSGIIIDLRGNVGGMVGMIIGVAGHFTEKPISLGALIARDNTLKLPANPRFVDTSGKRVQPFAGPVAVLVDEITASASEVFTGGLQEHGRVRVFGRTTAGQALPAVYDKLPNGDALYHPVADFITGKGVRFEGRGVVPDEAIALDRRALISGDDPALERAIQWIDRRR
ncbi:MAG: S41 family peptidase [Limisphaerales bacterium]